MSRVRARARFGASFNRETFPFVPRPVILLMRAMERHPVIESFVFIVPASRKLQVRNARGYVDT